MENNWDNGSIGNAWSDWSGTGEYRIPGLANSTDRFPWHYPHSAEDEQGYIADNPLFIPFILMGYSIAAVIVIFVLYDYRKYHKLNEMKFK
jgi:hypothetical protein